MTQASIYTMASGPVKKGRAWLIYVLSSEGTRGEASKIFKAMAPALTGRTAQLMVAVLAFRRFNKPCRIDLYTEWAAFPELLSRVPEWKKNGWKTAKGSRVVDRDLLEELDGYMQKYDVTIHVGEHHGYRKWMLGEIEEAKDGKRGDFVTLKSRGTA